VPKPPRKAAVSTATVGGLTALSMLLGALSSGIGLALVFMAVSAALTGLYVLATGRRSWPLLPEKRKAGAGVKEADKGTEMGSAALDKAEFQGVPRCL
jgi:hypothetical protein